MPKKPPGTKLVKDHTRLVIFRLDNDIYKSIHRKMLDEEDKLKPKKANKFRGLCSKLLQGWLEGRYRI